MEISIFPKCKALPENKEEKIENARYAYYPTVVDISNFDDLVNVITNNAWSPSIFSGKRIKENFVKTDFMVLDIDNGLTMEKAMDIVQLEMDVACLCMPSTSHTPEHHKFRLIFPLLMTVMDQKSYTSTWNYITKFFPESDEVCKDSSRFYFGCRNEPKYVHTSSSMLKPIIVRNKSKLLSKKKIKIDDFYTGTEFIKKLYNEDREYIPECVDFFIKNAYTGLEGKWWRSLNDFVFVLSLQEVPYETIYSMVEELAPEELDSKDENTIELAYHDGQNVERDTL